MLKYIRYFQQSITSQTSAPWSAPQGAEPHIHQLKEYFEVSLKQKFYITTTVIYENLGHFIYCYAVFLWHRVQL